MAEGNGKTLVEALASITADINEKSSPPENTKPAGPEPGADIAQHFRDSADKTARAIIEQAEQRLQWALSWVEEAKAKLERAKQIAQQSKEAGEAEAKRALALAARSEEFADMMSTMSNKFVNTLHEVGTVEDNTEVGDK